MRRSQGGAKTRKNAKYGRKRLRLTVIHLIVSGLVQILNLVNSAGSNRRIKNKKERVSGANGSESLCRDGTKTRWWLQWMY